MSSKDFHLSSVMLLDRVLKEEESCLQNGNEKLNKIDADMKRVDETFAASANTIHMIFDDVLATVKKWKAAFLDELHDGVRLQHCKLESEKKTLMDNIDLLKQTTFVSKVKLRECNDSSKTDALASLCLENLMPIIQQLSPNDDDKEEVHPVKFVANESFINELIQTDGRYQMGYIQHLPLEIDRFILQQKERSYMGTNATFTITVPSEYDLKKISNHLTWSVRLNGEVVHTWASLNNNEIKIDFTPTTMDVYKISVFVMNQHITGSPSTFIPLPATENSHKLLGAQSAENYYSVLSDNEEWDDEDGEGQNGKNDSFADFTSTKPSQTPSSGHLKRNDPRIEMKDLTSRAPETVPATMSTRQSVSSQVIMSVRRNDNSNVDYNQNFMPSAGTPNSKYSAVNETRSNSAARLEVVQDLSLIPLPEPANIPTKGVDRTTKIRIPVPLKLPSMKQSPSMMEEVRPDKTRSNSDSESKITNSSSSQTFQGESNYYIYDGKFKPDQTSSWNGRAEAVAKPGINTMLLEEAVSKFQVSNVTRRNANELAPTHTLNDNNNNRTRSKSVGDNCTFSQRVYRREDSPPPVVVYSKKDGYNKGFTPEPPTLRRPLDKDTESEKNTISFMQAKLVAKCQFVYVGERHEAMQQPIGVAQLHNMSIVVADTFANRLILLSSMGRFLREFPTHPFLKHPSAIAVLPNGNFAVRDNRCLHLFSPSCQYIRPIGVGVLKRPFGLALDAKCHLVTIETGLDNQMILFRFDPVNDGVVDRVVIESVAPHIPGQRMSMPRFIACQLPEIVLIVDLGLDTIYKVEMTTGKVVRRIGKRGSQKGEFNDPSGVVCDAEGFIMVGDSRNHRIQMFSSNGDFVSVLPVDRPLKRPSGLCLTPDGNLLVLNYWENSLVKYKLEALNKRSE